MTNEPKDSRLAEAERKKAEADAAAAELDFELKKIEISEKRSQAKHEKWKRRTARAKETYAEAFEDFNYGVVRFTDEVRDRSVAAAREQLRALAALQPGEPIRVEINSPGGSIYAGLDLFDEIRRISADITEQQKPYDDRPPITTVIYGRAASMAGILAQAGDWRVINRNAYLHIHSGFSGVWGRLDDMADEVDQLDRLTKHAARIYADRATDAGKPITTKKVRKLFDRRELWLGAEEALRLGFVDEAAG